VQVVEPHEHGAVSQSSNSTSSVSSGSSSHADRTDSASSDVVLAGLSVIVPMGLQLAVSASGHGDVALRRGSPRIARKTLKIRCCQADRCLELNGLRATLFSRQRQNRRTPRGHRRRHTSPHRTWLRHRSLSRRQNRSRSHSQTSMYRQPAENTLGHKSRSIPRGW